MSYLKFVKLIAKRKSEGCRAPWYRRRTCPDILRRSYSAQSGSGAMYAGRFNHCDDAGHITHSSVLDRGR